MDKTYVEAAMDMIFLVEDQEWERGFNDGFEGEPEREGDLDPDSYLDGYDEGVSDFGYGI